MGHVFARLAGRGLVLVAHRPYTFERSDGGDAVVVTHWWTGGPASALVDPSDAHTVPGIVDIRPVVRSLVPRSDRGLGPAMGDDQRLDVAEHLVFQHLEDSPRPLWELRWPEARCWEVVAEVLGPALVALVGRGLVEVRRFDSWPSPWKQGVLLAGDDLKRESLRAEVWSGHSTAGTLAVHITEAGIQSGLL